MRRPSSVSVRIGRVVLCTVVYGLNVICIGTWRDSTWTWRNCGGARCRGAPCGRARPKTVWITFGERMMFRGKSSRPAWNTFFRRGLFHVGCGRTLSTREYQRMFSCSVISTCRWCTITGSRNGVSRISHSGGTTCPSCERCCLCRWPSLGMGLYRQAHPALDRYVRLSRRRSWKSRPGRPDVLTDGGDQCV